MKRWLLAARTVPLLVIVLVWQLVVGASPARAFYFSTPQSVLRTLVSDIANGSLLRHSLVTAVEAATGFVSGNLLGAVLGLSLWYVPTIALISRPYLVALGAVPIFALAPITIMWFGVGIWAKIVLAFLATVFVAASQSWRGAEQADPLLLNRLRVFGATRFQMFRLVVVPSSAVWVLSSLRLTVGLALVGAFIGEFIASERGLGYMIVRASGLFDTARVFVGIIAIVLMASGLDRGVDWIEVRALAWKGETRASRE